MVYIYLTSSWNCFVRIRCCILDMKYLLIPIDCKSIIGFLAIALILSVKILYWWHKCRVWCEKIVFTFILI